MEKLDVNMADISVSNGLYPAVIKDKFKSDVINLLNEIIDWINEQEKPDSVRCCLSIQNVIDAIDTINKATEKPIEKKCENCNNLSRMTHPLLKDNVCVLKHKRTEDCLTNNYKHFERKA